MNVELLLPSNYVHLMVVTNIKGMGLSAHYWAINPPAQVQRKERPTDWKFTHTRAIQNQERQVIHIEHTHKLLYKL